MGVYNENEATLDRTRPDCGRDVFLIEIFNQSNSCPLYFFIMGDQILIFAIMRNKMFVYCDTSGSVKP